MVATTVLVLVSILSIGIITSVMGNICVIYVVLNNRRMRNATNMLISSLAVSDIFLGAIVLPQNVHDMTHSANFHEGVVACKLVNCLPIFCIFCSIYTMVAMSFERYLAIACMPPKSMSVQWTRSVVAGVWLAAIVICIPTLVEYDVYHVATAHPGGHTEVTQQWGMIGETTPAAVVTSPEEEVTSDAEYVTNSSIAALSIIECGSKNAPELLRQINAVFLLLVAYVAPTCFIWVNYGRLIRFIIAHFKQADADDADSDDPPGLNKVATIAPPMYSNAQAVRAAKKLASFRRKVKIVKMLVAVAALFQVCWLPYFTLLLYTKMTGKDDSQNNNGVFNVLRLFLSVFSVSYNAYLYAICNPMFRRGFKNIVCLGRSRMPVSDMTSFPSTTGDSSVHHIYRNVQVSPQM